MGGIWKETRRGYYTKPGTTPEVVEDEKLVPWRKSAAEFGMVKNEDGTFRKIKISTNMPLMPVVENAREVLLSLYDKLLLDLEEFPDDDHYKVRKEEGGGGGGERLKERERDRWRRRA